jgi:multidrug transporter EmrE-like cation transporter
MFLIAMVAYGFSEYWSKLYAISGNYIYVFFALIMYVFTTALWFPCIKYVEKLSIIGNLWNVSYFLITLAIGFFVFHESVSNAQMVGIIMGVISMILIVFG